jgi:hypothetical protein
MRSKARADRKDTEHWLPLPKGERGYSVAAK